jgi:DNA (cytosine-5)-methyltransferase 1
MTSSDLPFIEFFAGIGLVHEALRPLGWSPVLANDNDPKKVEAYKLNYPEVPFSDESVEILDVTKVPAPLLATASFPCVDVSQAGGRVGLSGAGSGLVWDFLRRVQDLMSSGKQPNFILIENVPGLISHSGRSVDGLLSVLANLDYAFDLIQVDARNFLPQARNRVFVIAVRADMTDGLSRSFPASHIRRHNVREAFLRTKHLPWVFFDFPDETPPRRTTLEDVIERVPPDDPRWWDDDRMAYFWAHLESRFGHDTRLQALAASGKRHVLTAVRRGRRRGVPYGEQIIHVREDGLASCLRTAGGGSSVQFVVEVDHGATRVRRLLGLESARLQGVCLPDASPNFRLLGSDNQVLNALGDAVCVPAVRWVVANSIQRVLEGNLEPRGPLELLAS